MVRTLLAGLLILIAAAAVELALFRGTPLTGLGFALAGLALLAGWTVSDRALARSRAEQQRTAAALEESEGLHRLVAEQSTDIILTTDRNGIVGYASPRIHDLGVTAESMRGRAVLDLVHPDYAGLFMAEHSAAVGRREKSGWVDYLALTPEGEPRWFEAKMQGLVGADDQVERVAVVLRSIEERREYEEKLFKASLTDPLTRLTNRPAFVSMLEYLVDNRVDGCLAIFDIDHFKHINLAHGHSAGDEVLVMFAKMARTLVRGDDIVSRIGGERFGVLLPRATPDQAEAVCQRIVSELSETTRDLGGETVRITVSGGVSRIAGSLDNTIKMAELALTVAKAKGRDRVEMATRPRLPWSTGGQGA